MDHRDIPYFSGPRSTPPEPEPRSADESAAESPQPDAPDVAVDAAVAGLPEVEAGEAGPAPEPAADGAAPPRRRIPRQAVVVAVGVVAVVVLVLGVWFAAYGFHKVTTPFIVGRTPDAAELILNQHDLVAGNARLVATSQFAAGRVMEQSPQTPTALKPGSRVDVVIATATANVTVPNVFMARTADAQKLLGLTLFVPVVITAYNTQVPVGQVASQLPRAGDSAFTGSEVFIVESLGPGSPGVVVPALVGKPSKVAASLLTTESLFPRMLTVDAPSVAPNTIVDQTPEAGTVLPVGTSVALSVTAPAP